MRKLVLPLLFTATAALAQYAPQTVPSMPLRTFQDSIGVNVHIEYEDGLYANIDTVIADLDEMGIHHVRDSAPDTFWANGALQNVEQAMAAGLKFDEIMQPDQTVLYNLDQIGMLWALNPNMIDGIEGWNEVNNLQGKTEAEAVAFQQQLYQQVKLQQMWNGVPVIDFVSGLAVHNLATARDADFANVHPYPAAGTTPQPTIAANFANNYVGSTNGFVTELGYSTLQDGVNGVSDYAQADYLADAIFDSALDGNQRIYLYELLDAYPPGSPAFSTWGLVNYADGSLKQSGQYLANMAEVIPYAQPSAQTAVKLTEGYLSGSTLFPGLPAGVKQLALTDASGDVYVWTWQESQVYTESSKATAEDTWHQLYIQLPQAGNYTVSGLDPFLDYTEPVQQGPFGDYAGYPYWISGYTQRPTCTIFHKN